MTRPQRILAASSFSLLALSAVLFFMTYKDRAAGFSALNILRTLAAIMALSLSIQGTRLRHRGEQ